MRLEAEVSEKQAEYIYATEPTVVYVGGVGAGKTIGNTLLALRYVEEFPGIRVLMCAPTYQMLHDTTMHEFFSSVPRSLITSQRSGSYPEAVVDFGRGESQILFRAFDDAQKAHAQAKTLQQNSVELANWLKARQALQSQSLQWSRVLSHAAQGVWVASVKQQGTRWTVQGEALSSNHAQQLVQQLQALDIWAQAPELPQLQVMPAMSTTGLPVWQFRIEADLKVGV